MKLPKLNIIESTCIILLAISFFAICVLWGKVSKLESDKEYRDCLELELREKTADMQAVNEKYNSMIDFMSQWEDKARVPRDKRWRK